MIGLEGSGFTICLGVILLLTGMVMYYCKSKITQNEHKINSMFKLVTALSDEVNMLKAQQRTLDMRVPQQPYSPPEQNTLEEVEETAQQTSSFSNHPYAELIPKNSVETLSDSEDSQSETDEEEEDIKLNIEEDDTANIKVVDLGEIDELKVEEEEEEEDDDQESSESSESEVETLNIDYTKMQVAALKKLVSERNLTTNVNKLRKNELITLLQAQ